MYRKRNAIILLAAAVVLAAGGCAGMKDNKASAAFAKPQYEWGDETGKTLTVWGPGADLERSYIVRAFEQYEKATGNTLEIVGFSNDSFLTEASLRMKEGKGPDILLSYGGTNIDAFDPEENFYDFSDAVWVKDLTATALNQTIYNGKVIGLPHWESSVSGTLYNKKIFEKNHIKVPRTKQEFMEACRILLENGVTPMYLPYTNTGMLLYQFPLDTLVEDEDTLKALNEGTLGYSDIPEMREVVEWYRTMAESGYFGENYQENGWDGMNEALNSGKYAMMLAWDIWLYTDFTGNASEFGLMPAFIGVPESGTFEGPNLALLIVNKNSSQVDAAVDFITFMADPYNYNKAFEGVYTAPVFKNQMASISTPQYVEADQWIEKYYRDSTAWLRIKGFSQVDAACIKRYMDGTPGYTVEQCLKDMDALREQRAFGE